ncbi:MAG: glycosyl hydrolase [Paenibacillus sp.]|nr:glycosyl hydrolase [Paenibacillus sp.]
MIRAPFKWLAIIVVWGLIFMAVPVARTDKFQAAAASADGTGYAQTVVSEVKFIDASGQSYLASPSLVRLDDGTLLASHDYFGPNAPKKTTSVYRSSDNGSTWTAAATLNGIMWATLFKHGEVVYLLGTSGPMESIVIRRSADGGVTWTTAADSASGLLFPGGTNMPSAYHTAPTPVLKANGRIYKAFESNTPYVWPENFKALVISAPDDADLLDAANWTITNEIAYDPSWTPSSWGSTDPGWLEGNAVQAPNGEIWNVLRFNSAPMVDKAAIVKVSADHAAVSFDPATGFIDLPGGMSKFGIRYDEGSGLYLSLVNDSTYPSKPRQRNVLSLYASADLRHWELVRRLITDDSGLSMLDSIDKVGFQYVDWQIDGDDLVYLSRTSYGGADDYHNSNRITLHRLTGFRSLLDSPAGYWKLDENGGSVATDSSVYGNVYGAVYGASWSPGYIGSALSFDGVDDYVDLGRSMTGRLDGAAALTIAGWFKASTLPASGQDGNWLFGTAIGPGLAGAEAYMHGNYIRIGGRSVSGESYRYKDFAFSSAGEWHHAAAVLDFAKDEIRLFLDGEERRPVQPGAVGFESPVYEPSPSGSSDAIGRSPADGGHFHGMLDEIKLYGKALAPAEVRSLAYDGLEGYWTFDGPDGPHALDASKYGRDAKVMGASRDAGEQVASGEQSQDKALRLDGTVDYVDLGYDVGMALRGSAGITVAGWVEAKALANSTAHWLFGTRINGTAAGAEVLIYGNAVRVAGRSSVADGYRYKEFAYPDGEERHHLVAILDYAGNRIALYVDGVEQTALSGTANFGSRTYARMLPTQRDAIGKNPAGTDTGFLAGVIDDVMVFSKPLTSVQVEHLYRVQASPD